MGGSSARSFIVNASGRPFWGAESSPHQGPSGRVPPPSSALSVVRISGRGGLPQSKFGWGGVMGGPLK